MRDMKKILNKRNLFLLLVVIVFAVVLNLKTSYSIDYDYKDMSDFANNTFLKQPIEKISNLNKTPKSLDSNKDDILSNNIVISSFEGNLRETIMLYKSNLDQNNSDLELMNYPRLKYITNGEYKYLLTFQNIDGNSANGINVYYTRSNDLKKWETPKKLYESYTENSVKYNYSSSDSVVLRDGRIMNVVAKVPKDVWVYTPEVFNKIGIYMKISSDGGKTWSTEKQIYSGYVWEPSITQLSTGEIQVYFTCIAPVEYINGSSLAEEYKNYIAVNGPHFNSSGVGMISSLDNANSFTPHIVGTNKKYNSSEINSYSPYVIIQQPVFWEDTSDIVDFTNLKTNGQSHKGISYNNKIVKMTDQMPVGVELNNKERMVMAVESVTVSNNCKDNPSISVKLRHKISLAYSDVANVRVNGVSKQKYWIDIKQHQANTNFDSEEKVYDNVGLGLTETGPNIRKNNFVAGAAPYIIQMPSGETILYFSGSDYPTIMIGDSNGEFDYIRTDDEIKKAEIIKEAEIKEAGKWSQFGSVARTSTHSIALLTAPYVPDDNNNNKRDHIGIHNLYLNHTLEVKNEILSNTNDDALFIGSASQAQMSIRTNYDLNNIYFYIDWLDQNIVAGQDYAEIKVNAENLKYNGTTYDYLRVGINSSGLATVKLVKKNGTKTTETDIKNSNLVKANISQNSTATDVNARGIKAVITIPKNNFNLTAKELRLFAMLQNNDTADASNQTKDYFGGLGENSDISKWIKLKLVNPKEKVKIPDSPVSKTYTGNMQDHGITIPANASIVSSNSTISAQNAGEYIVTLKLDDTSRYVWSDGSSGNKQIKWKIVQATPKITLTAKTGTYSGNAIEANQASVNINGVVLVYKYYTNDKCTVETTTKTGAKSNGSAPVNAGTYYAKATADATTNIKQASSSCVKHVINKKKLTIPTKIGDKIYTGSEQDSGIQCPEGSKSSGDLKGTKVKSYTQICTLSSTINYVWSDGTTNPIKIEWKILAPEDSYKVTFMSEGKEFYSGYVSSGKKISRPAPNPTKDNYRFDDWYTDETFKTKFDFNTAIKQNVSVYAKFIEQVKITIDTNGGKNNGFETIAVDKGSTLKKSDIESKITLLVTPPAGKRFDYVTVNNEKWTEDTYAFNNDTVIKIIWKDAGVKYTILSGDNQTYEVDSNKDIVIKADGELEKLVKVKLDGIEVNSSNYELKSGSTILTLKSNYLNTLEPGTHKLELEYSDGIVNTEIIITKIENVVSNTKKANDNLIIIIASIADALLLAFIIFMCRKNRKKSSVME